MMAEPITFKLNIHVGINDPFQEKGPSAAKLYYQFYYTLWREKPAEGLHFSAFHYSCS